MISDVLCLEIFKQGHDRIHWMAVSADDAVFTDSVHVDNSQDDNNQNNDDNHNNPESDNSRPMWRRMSFSRYSPSGRWNRMGAGIIRSQYQGMVPIGGRSGTIGNFILLDDKNSKLLLLLLFKSANFCFVLIDLKVGLCLPERTISPVVRWHRRRSFQVCFVVI